MATQSSLFDMVFTPAAIYDYLFFNVKSVLEYPTLEKLKEQNPDLYERWKYLSKVKYNTPFDTVGIASEGYLDSLQTVYEENAVYYPEFCKVLAITYGSMYHEEGTLKRTLKKIASDDEKANVNNFMDVLNVLGSEAPQVVPTLCGHNIINGDIPLLIKRYIYHSRNNEIKPLPYLLKRCLIAKPWESVIVDTVNVWKFNGFNGNEYNPLMLISDFLGFKKTTDIRPPAELSKLYWNTAATDPAKALEFVSLQSAAQTNTVMMLMKELRQF